MNVAATLSVTAAAMAAAVGVLCLRFAPAPGWGHLRRFSLVAFTAALYSASNVPQTLAGAPDALIMVANQVSWSALGLHVAAWIGFGGALRRLEGDPAPALDRVAIGAVLAVAALAWWPGALVSGPVGHHRVPWLGIDYRIAEVTPLADVSMVLLFAAGAIPVRNALRRVRQRAPGANAQAAGFVLLLFTAALEVVAVLDLWPAPYLLDVGFLVCLLGIGGELSRRLTRDARALAELSTRLERMADERGRELAAAHAALARSERMAALGRLSGSVAHGINSPLSAVKANAAFVAAELERLGQEGTHEVREAAVEILEGADRIATIVKDLGTFAAVLREPPSPDLTPVPGLPLPGGPPSLQVTRVLVADADPALLQRAAAALSDLAVVTAATRSEALAALVSGEALDVVICSLDAPNPDGIGLHAHVSELRPDLARRFIALTGGDLAQHERAFLKATGVPRLARPLDAGALRARIEWVLAAEQVTRVG